METLVGINQNITEIALNLKAQADALDVSYTQASAILNTAFASWNSASKKMEQLEFENLDALAASRNTDPQSAEKLE